MPARAQSLPERKPLYEVGVFGIFGYLPDYPGSSQSHFHYLPLPFLIYRGHFFRADPHGFSGVLIDRKDFRFDISASGAFETSSSDKARTGMPHLDDMGQIGPRLNVLLAHDQRYARVEFELPARAVFSTNFKSIAYRGWQFAPELAYIHEDFMNTGGRLKLGLTANFATQELMSYFYTVAPAYATATRPQYSAKAGYLDTGMDLSYRIPLNSRMTLYTRVNGDYLGGATNSASPLLVRKWNFGVAMGLTFSIFRSQETVADGD